MAEQAPTRSQVLTLTLTPPGWLLERASVPSERGEGPPVRAPPSWHLTSFAGRWGACRPLLDAQLDPGMPKRILSCSLPSGLRSPAPTLPCSPACLSLCLQALQQQAGGRRSDSASVAANQSLVGPPPSTLPAAGLLASGWLAGSSSEGLHICMPFHFLSTCIALGKSQGCGEGSAQPRALSCRRMTWRPMLAHSTSKFFLC